MRFVSACAYVYYVAKQSWDAGVAKQLQSGESLEASGMPCKE